MEKNKNFEKTVIDESANLASPKADQQPKEKMRKLKLKNLSLRQKGLLQSAAAGVSGIALGAVVMSLMGASGGTEGEEADSSTNNKSNTDTIEIPIYPEAPFSEVVTDDMSFNEAFAAARKDVGAGGFFEWKGSTYNTYYKEEWDALTPEQQNDFMASVNPPSGGEILDKEDIVKILNGDDDPFDGLDHEDIVILDDDIIDNPIDLNDVVVIEDEIKEIDELSDVVVIEDDPNRLSTGREDIPWEPDTHDGGDNIIESA